MYGCLLFCPTFWSWPGHSNTHVPQVPTNKETITFSEFIQNAQIACHFIVVPAPVVVFLPSCHLCFNWQGALICQTIPLQSKLWAGCGQTWTLSNKAPSDTHAKTCLDLNSFFFPLSYQICSASIYLPQHRNVATVGVQWLYKPTAPLLQFLLFSPHFPKVVLLLQKCRRSLIWHWCVTFFFFLHWSLSIDESALVTTIGYTDDSQRCSNCPESLLIVTHKSLSVPGTNNQIWISSERRSSCFLQSPGFLSDPRASLGFYSTELQAWRIITIDLNCAVLWQAFFSP